MSEGLMHSDVICILCKIKAEGCGTSVPVLCSLPDSLPRHRSDPSESKTASAAVLSAPAT